MVLHHSGYVVFFELADVNKYRVCSNHIDCFNDSDILAYMTVFVLSKVQCLFHARKETHKYFNLGYIKTSR